MKEPFQLILITSPEDFADEHLLLQAMFSRGLDRLHVRKPHQTERQLELWLQNLGFEYKNQIVLHGHPDIVESMNLSGLHAPVSVLQQHTGIPHLSTSLHSWAEVSDISAMQASLAYAFLSPVFDSLSKTDYPAAFSEQDLNNRVKESAVPLMALGGIHSDKLAACQKWQFAGAAVLGAVWNAFNPLQAWDNLYQTHCSLCGKEPLDLSPIESWRDRQAHQRLTDVSWNNPWEQR